MKLGKFIVVTIPRQSNLITCYYFSLYSLEVAIQAMQGIAEEIGF
ncbi:MAG: hypothetical protein QGI60_00295 [archaeon]|jgi:hypothetical protein|nr:hypothetical protein [archaeon]